MAQQLLTLRTLERIALVAICVGSGVTPLAAQNGDSAPPSIRASGRATVIAAPEQAEIDLGVVSQADSSRRASAENARHLARVLEAITKAAGPAATTRTLTYSLRPEYRQPVQAGGEPFITGYTATNVVRVTLPEISHVSDIIDAAAAAGANRVDRIRFTLRDPEAVRSKALGQAAADARAQAQSLAMALGVRIVRVLSASEETPIVRPFAEAVHTARLDAAPVSTPIEPGPIEVSATVIVTVEVSAMTGRN